MSFLAFFKSGLETTLNDLQNDFIFDLESDLDMTLVTLAMALALVGELDCDLALPSPSPSQVRSSCNFEVIQSMQHQKQLVYINQHISPSLKFARSPW